jgi:hypothetical protein
MSWDHITQRRYMEIVPKSHPYARIMMTKLVSDTDLQGKLPAHAYFLIEDALAEAYRAGSIDTLAGETE